MRGRASCEHAWRYNFSHDEYACRHCGAWKPAGWTRAKRHRLAMWLRMFSYRLDGVQR